MATESHAWDRAQTAGQLSEQAWLGEEPAQGFGFCAQFQCFQPVFGSSGGLQAVEHRALLHMAFVLGSAATHTCTPSSTSGAVLSLIARGSVLMCV